MGGISDLLDSDMEESVPFIDENSILSSASDQSSITTLKQKPGQAKKQKPKKRHRLTVPKKARVTKITEEPSTKKPTKKATGAKQRALEEHLNSSQEHRAQEDAIDAEVVTKPKARKPAKKAAQEDVKEMEVDLIPLAEEAIAKPKARKPAKKPAQEDVKEMEVDLIPLAEDAMDAEVVAKPKARKPAKKAAQEDIEEMEVDLTPLAARSACAGVKRNAPKMVTKPRTTTKSKQSNAIPQATVPESQLEPGTETDVADVSEVATMPPPKTKVRTDCRVPPDAQFRKRAGSASDTERGDHHLRRKLGDVTRQFENVNLKYRNLKEIGINEANANMEKLRKQCEMTTAASSELVASLKRELAMQMPLVQESRKLKKALQARDVETGQLRQNIVELTLSLSVAQNENKALQAKLSASRSASASVESAGSKTPGSALKNAGQARTVMIGSAEAAQAAQVAQMKEDLYSDLTGLIIRGVKRTEEGDTFDCIQTGRNGSRFCPDVRSFAAN